MICGWAPEGALPARSWVHEQAGVEASIEASAGKARDFREGIYRGGRGRLRFLVASLLVALPLSTFATATLDTSLNRDEWRFAVAITALLTLLGPLPFFLQSWWRATAIEIEQHGLVVGGDRIPWSQLQGVEYRRGINTDFGAAEAMRRIGKLGLYFMRPGLAIVAVQLLASWLASAVAVVTPLHAMLRVRTDRGDFTVHDPADADRLAAVLRARVAENRPSPGPQARRG